MFMFVTVCIVCGYGFDVSLLLVPVATLFAITQLRSSMPGAPVGFGRDPLFLCSRLLLYSTWTISDQVPSSVSTMILLVHRHTKS